jgi:hypothetical protein
MKIVVFDVESWEREVFDQLTGEHDIRTRWGL